MKFDLYKPIKTKGGLIRPGVVPNPTEWSEIKRVMWDVKNRDLIEKFRAGDKDAKQQLPAVCFVGTCGKTRSSSNMTPTQVVMIDIDHVEKPVQAYNEMLEVLQSDKDWYYDNVLLAAVTPSGHGLRLLLWASPEGGDTLAKQMDYYNKRFEFEKYGDFDAPCHDLSRISFIFKPVDILFENAQLLTATYKYPGDIIKASENVSSPSEVASPTLFEYTEFTDEEKASFESLEYRGTPVKVIVEKYIEHFGTPSSGEIHNYYNEMVKNFRCVCDNNQRALLYLLPRFGHTIGECASQIKSICKVNTLSSLPKAFYFFLRDSGYYKERGSSQQGMLKSYMMSEDVTDKELPPYLPPVFKQLVGICPVDFYESAINALLPIIGTLTSYAKARYPYDDREHTTSFFSVIYAPPGTGKGFVERFQNLLFKDLVLRDYIQSQRENVYLRMINKKSQNDKSPDMPHTSLRIIPPKNSEAEFLQKQSDNKGYHMFTYAAEMDSWAKGVKAAGGNKDDMIRIAWDNGLYGQQFKSAATFKGTVPLYWNVLITGTLQQVENYFKNVENGLVTRCSFTSIENQEFALAPKWKSINKKGLEVISRFIKRCDEMTYTEPCTISIEDVNNVSDEDFDKEIDWRFHFKEKVEFDCSWIMPTIDRFHKEQVSRAVLDVDRARDVFRRRVGVRGFRLALMCMCLWPKPTKKDLDNCCKFIWWWMHRDIESMLRLWGAKYNEQADTAPTLVQRTVFNELHDVFSKSDVYIVCTKQGIKTPVRRITFDWKKLGYIEQIDKETFKKIKK